MTLDFARIGQIGLGYMGASLAERLRDLGKTAIGHDIDAEKMAAAAEVGVTCLDSAAAVTREVDVVVICVTSTDCVEQAVFGPGGVAEAGAAGKVLIDISTTVAEATRDMATRLKQQTGMDWIDAPVSGGPPAAGSGALTVMAGGDAAVFDSLSPLWDDLTAKATLMGPIGAGQVTKMINQVLCLTLYPILAEALKLGENAGVEVARIPEALGAGYAGSNLLQAMFPRMVARQYTPPAAFARQLLKDLDMVYDLAKATKTPTPMTDQARTLYRLLIARGHGEEDPISLLKFYDEEPV
jgi:3-hydroxyisobutyrate dehydrogenase-like beta-hydroxyacid dehydrogenase